MPYVRYTGYPVAQLPGYPVFEMHVQLSTG